MKRTLLLFIVLSLSIMGAAEDCSGSEGRVFGKRHQRGSSYYTLLVKKNNGKVIEVNAGQQDYQKCAVGELYPSCTF